MEHDEIDYRGFDAMVGKTIKGIDTQAINVVKITFTDGSMHEIWAENRHCGIEIIEAVKVMKE